MNDCEPLRGKERTWYEYGEHTNHENIETKCFNKSDVASAVRFYERYRVSTEQIKTNYKLGGVYNIDLWNDYPKLVEEYLDQDRAYNDWLFDYCFGDIEK